MEIIINGLIEVFQFSNLLFIIIGVGLGIIFGALPGLTATMGVALLSPLTFGMPATTAMFFLLGIYCGGIYGGSIPGILINAPGTPASAATVADGYNLTKKGRGGEALRMAVFASAIAGVFSAIILLVIAPQIAKFALKFGPTEYFALAFFGLTMIASVSGKSIVKGIMMGAIGMLIATVGQDPIGGVLRFTFDNVNLMSGISLIPALVGLFAISEIINLAQYAHLKPKAENKFVDTKLPIKKALKYKKTILKSSAIGTFVGAIPGTGSTIASFMSYNEAKRASKDKKKFGKGSLEGVAASEAGNNGVTGAALIPLLTLGVPGDTVTAVMIGALMMQGLTPGPQLFVNYGDVVYAIMIGLIIVNIIMYIQGLLATRLFVRITAIPMSLLVPIILTLSVVGSFAVNNTMFDVKIMMLFGLIGYIMPKFGFPVTPLLLGIVLGPIAENSFRQMMIISDGNLSFILSKPIAVVFLLLAFLSFFYPLLKKLIESKSNKQKESAEIGE